MKVILLQDVSGIGRKYEVKEVSNGYARNFLIVRKLAEAATPATMNKLKIQKENWEKQTVDLREKLKKIQETSEDNPLTFKLKIGDKGKAYGALTKKEIEDGLKELDKTPMEVILKESIKTLGDHQIEIDFGRGVRGNVKIRVQKEV